MEASSRHRNQDEEEKKEKEEEEEEEEEGEEEEEAEAEQSITMERPRTSFDHAQGPTDSLPGFFESSSFSRDLMGVVWR